MSGVLRKMNLEVDLGGDGLQELSNWIKKLHEARTGGHAMEGVLNDMQREMKNLGVTFTHPIDQTNYFNKAIQGVAGAGIAAKIIDAGKEIIKLSADYETAAISFEVMLGSAEKAKQTMADLNKFAIDTPYEPKEVNAAAQTLLQFDVAQKDLLSTMRMIGDVASGTGKNYEDLARVYGKANAMGKADNEMLQQVPALYAQLSKSLGVSKTHIFEMASSGQISFALVQKAFKEMTGEGGKFFGMMDKQSRTWTGLMSTLSGNIDEVKRAGGDMLAAALKPLIDSMGQLFGWISQNEAAMQVVKKVFIVLIPIIGVALVAALLAAAAAAWAFVSPFIPFILIGAAIIAIIMAIILTIEDIYTWFQGGESVFGEWLDPLADNINKVKAFFVNGWKSIRDFFEKNGKYIVMALFPLSALYYYWDEISNFFRSIPDRIVSFFEDLPGRLVSAMSGLGDRLKDLLKDILPGWAIKLIGNVSASTIEARAGGGPVSAGNEYLVGELEPEIFTPRSSGYITPLSSIPGGSGSKAVNITIAPVINFNGSAARDDAETIINKVIQVIEEKIYQAGLMAGLEAV
jgi:tape measure domain-containing protein